MKETKVIRNSFCWVKSGCFLSGTFLV